MDEKPNKTSDREYYMFALRIVGDFGASIAIPVVVLALLGKFLDQKYHHAPWFMVGGFVLAAFTSGKLIYRKAKLYGSEYQRMDRR